MSEVADSFNPRIDRYDQRSVERIFRRLWPDDATSRACAEILADSIRTAHSAGEECWSVTMFRNYLRLNVAQVETLTLSRDWCRVLFVAPLGEDVDSQVEILQTGKPVYVAVPVPSGVCVLAPDHLAAQSSVVRSAHRAYIRAAASYKRKSSFRKAFSPAILPYLEATMGNLLPRPAYLIQGLSPQVDPLPDEISDIKVLFEGARYQVTVNAYERDPEARRQCIMKQGSECVICGFSFGESYGEVAEGFIHVHHVQSLAEIGREYRVNPDTDLRPVCPNCHAVLHRRIPPYSVAEVRAYLQDHTGRK